MISGNRGNGFPSGPNSLINDAGLFPYYRWESRWGAWLALSYSLAILSSSCRAVIVAVISRSERLDRWERLERSERSNEDSFRGSRGYMGADSSGEKAPGNGNCP